MTEPPPCPACTKPKHPAQRLCRGCWYTLPRAARAALNRRDTKAAARLLELHRQLHAGVPLHQIQITR